MSNKRTIDAYFNTPKAKKPRNSDHFAGDDETIVPVLPLSNSILCSYVKSTDSRVNIKVEVKHTSPTVAAAAAEAGYSTHSSYPFPIAHLPDDLEREIVSPPARAARVIADQPDLDLLYFEPYVARQGARRLFEFLRAELPFYRVEYDINRFGTKTHIRTPRWTTVFGVDATACFETNPISKSSSSDPQSQSLDAKVIDKSTGKPIPVGLPETHKPPGGRKNQAGYTATPRPIPRCLDVLRKSTEAATGCEYNFCLVNYYASGTDSISFHSDDERFLGANPAIASFSLGARRDFLMKHKPPPTTTKSGAAEKTNGGNAASLKAAALKLPLGSGDMVLMRGATQANWLHSIPKRSGKNEWDGGRINITFRRALVRGGTENYYQYNVGSGPVYKWNTAAQEMQPWIQPSKP
ncbi:hypothetical protein F4777DRAFT_575690 [Nemania sp. FL0916]|nr:hypothetical protein F4777DRAFT_575690 [Nemania sp. FL0916]